MKRFKLTPLLGVIFLLNACTQLEGCTNKPSSLEPEKKPDVQAEAPSEKVEALAQKVTAAPIGRVEAGPEGHKNLVIDPEKVLAHKELKKLCIKQLKDLPGKLDMAALEANCAQMIHLPECLSEKKVPIYHYDKISYDPQGKRILVISLIHGDEHPSGSVSRSWMARLDKLNPRNSWRVIPVANPDGLEASTRINSNGVDINRNFPTQNWDNEAIERWKTVKNSDPRRYPGPSGGSESETRCLIKHFEDFKPDFIISIHTPLGVLDYDGPKVNFPQFAHLPWISLGHFPGSLGRFMWKDHKVPVMTIELKGTYGVDKLEKFDHLQDISGTVAIQAGEVLKQEESASN